MTEDSQLKTFDFWEELQRDNPVRKGYQQLQELLNSPALLLQGEKWKLGFLYERLESLAVEVKERVFQSAIDDNQVPSDMLGIYGYHWSLYRKQERLAQQAQDNSLLTEKSFLQKVEAVQQYKINARNWQSFLDGLLGHIKGIVATAAVERDFGQLDLVTEAMCSEAEVLIQHLKLDGKEGGSPAELAKLESAKKRAEGYQALIYSSLGPVPASALDKEYPFLPDGLDYQRLCVQVLSVLRNEYQLFTANAQGYFRRQEEEIQALVDQFLAEEGPLENGEERPEEVEKAEELRGFAPERKRRDSN